MTTTSVKQSAPIEVLVVGGGPAGLAAAAELRRRDLQVKVVDRGSAVGDSWRGHYDRLHLHTVRWLSHLPGLRIPRRHGPWVPRDGVVAYLDAYARHHRLDISQDTTVTRVDRVGQEYLVRTDGGDIRCRSVVVATGYNRIPYLPAWSGRRDYAGKLIHAAEYRNPGQFLGQDVLVAGSGNSGAEIACDLAEGGARRVHLAVRTSPNIVRRAVLGMPNQVLGMLMRHLPPRLVDRIAAVQQRLLVGDLRSYGLAPAAKGLYTRIIEDGAIPLIDVGFLAALRRGQVDVVPAVAGFAADQVILTDGRRLHADAVIAATGYRRGLEPLVGDLGILDSRGDPKVHGGVTDPSLPGLYFIGYTNPISGNLRELKLDARRIARAAASASLPGRRRTMPLRLPGRLTPGLVRRR